MNPHQEPPLPRTRPSIAIVLALFLTAIPATALGHAELVGSRPASDAVLEAPPHEVVVSFDAELDPDTSHLEVAGSDGIVVGEGGVDLDVADRNVLRATVAIPGAGEYRVSWTAGSIDGHVETGAFTFRVDAAATAGVADTALPGPSPDGVLLGAILVAVAAALATREWRREP